MSIAEMRKYLGDRKWQEKLECARSAYDASIAVIMREEACEAEEARRIYDSRRRRFLEREARLGPLGITWERGTL